MSETEFNKLIEEAIKNHWDVEMYHSAGTTRVFIRDSLRVLSSGESPIIGGAVSDDVTIALFNAMQTAKQHGK